MRRFHRSKRFALACIIPLLVGAAYAPSHAAFPNAVEGEPLPSLAPVLERVSPTVVNIGTRGKVQSRNPIIVDPFYRRFFGYEKSANTKAVQSLGSGVIVDAGEGLIVTNHHVIKNASDVLVTVNDGREFSAKIIGSDPQSDIAVIQIVANSLTEISWADSTQLRVGDFTMAIGSPYGHGQTVTSGIVSALGKKSLEGFIQTDATINPSNSGGALINLRGELLGINTAIVGPSGENAGIGFAIPANVVREVAIQIIRNVMVPAAEPVSAVNHLASSTTLSNQQTNDGQRYVLVDAVRPGSVVANSGLNGGDIILNINNEKVVSTAQVEEMVSKAGPKLVLLIQRGRSTFNMTLQNK